MFRAFATFCGIAALLAQVPAADGSIDRSRLFADQGPVYLYPAEPDAGGSVTIRLRTAPDDLTEAAVQYRPAGDSIQTLAMTRRYTGAYDLWEAVLTVGAIRLEYWFRARDGASQVYLNAFEISTSQPARLNFWIIPGFHTPGWAKGATWYQIFPDRFFDGNPVNNVYTGEYNYYGPVQAKSWGAAPGGSSDFFGGDLNGVTAKLDAYLQQNLGIEALYLNPVFVSPSNHKYDTQDYRNVDNHFGGNAALSQLSAAARNDSGFPGDYPVRIVLDGVFNHCGDWHFWFDRAHQWGTSGAYESQSSPWYSFFNFTSWPNNYVTFGVSFGGHFDSMPKLNYADAGLKSEIYAGAASIAKFWLAPPYSVDGWRLDVGQEVGENGQIVNGVGLNNHTIWGQFRQAVKSANPDAIILGEFWGTATPWLMGDQWDSVMNYNGFTTPLGMWLLKTDLGGGTAVIDTPTLHNWLQGTLADNPGQVRLVMLNFLSSHDISRVFYRASGNTQLLQGAAAFLFAYPGAPCVYYGDEVALDGGWDPDNRRTFPWNELGQPARAAMLDFYRDLIGLHREKSALRTGSYQELLADEPSGTFAFARSDGKDLAVTVIRRKGSAAASVVVPLGPAGVPDGATLTDYFTGLSYPVQSGLLDLGTVAGEDFRVLLLTSETVSWTPFSVAPGRQTVFDLASPDGALHAGWARFTFDDPAMKANFQAAVSFRYALPAATVTETSLYPAVPATRFQAFVNFQQGSLNSGLALTNPGTQTAHLTLRLTTQTGTVFTAALNLAAGQSYPRFLDGLFTGLPGEVRGILEGNSDQPVAPMQLAVRTNERGEFLLSALPVMTLQAAGNANELILNYFAVGDGYSSTLHLAGPGATAAITGFVSFFDESGAPLPLVLAKQ